MICGDILPDILVDACGWVAVVDAGINIDYGLINIFGKYQFLLLPLVQKELEEINQKRSPHQPLLLDLLLKKSKIVEPLDEASKHTDNQLFSLSRHFNMPVLTVDRDLKNKLHESNLPVIHVTGNHRLEFIE